MEQNQHQNVQDQLPTTTPEALEEQVLRELSALLNTLTSIEEVLLDVERLTSPEGGPTSFFVKQETLLNELHQWKNVDIGTPKLSI